MKAAKNGPQRVSWHPFQSSLLGIFWIASFCLDAIRSFEIQHIFEICIGLCTPGMGLHRMQRTKCICPQVRLFQGVCWQLMECMRRGTCSVVSLPQTWTSKTEEEGLFWLSRVWCLSFKICVADFCWTALGCVFWYCLSKGMKVAFNVTQGEKASWTEVKCAIW